MHCCPFGITQQVASSFWQAQSRGLINILEWMYPVTHLESKTGLAPVRAHLLTACRLVGRGTSFLEFRELEQCDVSGANSLTFFQLPFAQ